MLVHVMVTIKNQLENAEGTAVKLSAASCRENYSVLETTGALKRAVDLLVFDFGKVKQQK